MNYNSEVAMSSPRVVVVEDEAPIRRGVCDALRTSGYHVTEAPDGEKGLHEAIQLGVELVLLEMGHKVAPGSGVAAAQRVWAQAVPQGNMT